MDGISERLEDVENILVELMSEEDMEEREGLVRVGIDKICWIRAELMRLNRLEKKQEDRE